MPEPTPPRRGQRPDRSRHRRPPGESGRRSSPGTGAKRPSGQASDASRRGGGKAAAPGPAPAVGPDGDVAALDLLRHGTLTVEGRLVDASNATLYCVVEHDNRSAACVYKPVTGERPLWDFPPGTLAAREVAAYTVSVSAGWGIVPPTVFRDGPFGPGMCQLWIDADTSADLLALARSCDHEQLRDMAVFDAVVNNADRKAGHLLPVSDGRLYGCDHGVCFAEEYKLRTVLWQWRGEPLPERDLDALARVKEGLESGQLGAELASLLSSSEVRATRDRVDALLRHRVHPFPPENWPAVPWPPI